VVLIRHIGSVVVVLLQTICVKRHIGPSSTTVPYTCRWFSSDSVGNRKSYVDVQV